MQDPLPKAKYLWRSFELHSNFLPATRYRQLFFINEFLGHSCIWLQKPQFMILSTDLKEAPEKMQLWQKQVGSLDPDKFRP